MPKTDPITVGIVTWSESASELSVIRRQVFIDEQHVPEELEWDGLDPDALHVLAHVADQAVACGRLLADGHIGRMAVLKEWRGRGIGRAVLQTLLNAAHAAGNQEVFLHAQTTAIKFYEQAGFTVEGDEFMDAGIPHRTMRSRVQ